VIDKVGSLIGGMTYGAKKDVGLRLFQKALALNPGSPIAMIEYANGLVMLEGDKGLKEATRLYEQAAAGSRPMRWNGWTWSWPSSRTGRLTLDTVTRPARARRPVTIGCMNNIALRVSQMLAPGQHQRDQPTAWRTRARTRWIVDDLQLRIGHRKWCR
jgi:hypothetical protein